MLWSEFLVSVVLDTIENKGNYTLRNFDNEIP